MRGGRWQRRLSYWLRNSERARLLREEMDAHLDMLTQALMEEGMTEDDARRAARRQFGNATLQQEAARSTWVARWLSDLLQDSAFAARTLGKQPGFAAVAVLSAALGIGACSLIFALANFALFRPLPVNEDSRLMAVSGVNLRRARSGQSLAYPDIVDLRQAPSLQNVAAFFPFLPATISSNGEPERYWGSLVSANYFDVVQPEFVVGRGFDPARDDRPGEAPAVVLSYRLWRARFGGDGSIAGRTIELNRRKVTVAGVTGPGFQGTEVMFFSDFWLPFSTLGTLSQPGTGAERLQDRSGQWLLAAARLKSGTSASQAAAEIEGIGRRLRQAYPASNQDRSFHIERAGQINPGIRKLIVVFFALLLGVATLILCTACANIANLLLARAAARQKEIATRLAIGAGRSRLIRQLLTESVILALVGGVAGYCLAQLGARAISASRLPIAMPVDLTVTLDYRVVLFTTLLAACTGVIFGLAPALQATRPDLLGALKDDGGHFGGSRRFGGRNLLVIGQVAICTVLLVTSGLFLRSLGSAREIDTGLSSGNVLLVSFDPSLNGYNSTQTRRLLDRVVERATALPGVESASLTSSVPLSLEGTQNAFSPVGKEGDRQSGAVAADIYSVGPRFFDTFGIRRIAGEDFRPGLPADDIAIVNQALADRAFPQQNPVGRYIRYFDRTVRITGLVATAKSRSIGEDPHPCLYFPMARELRGNDSLSGITLALRTTDNPTAYAPLIKAAIRELDPALAVFDVRTMESQLSQALFVPRVTASLFGLAGFMGLLISTIGIYGVISFAVARRTREIGIRMAVGANRKQVLGMVLARGLILMSLGLAVGMGLSLVLSRVTASLLYGISPRDPLTFAAVPAALTLISLAACLVPARRAAMLDPLHALRYD